VIGHCLEGILVPRSRRRFGVLFYLTAIVALVVLVSAPSAKALRPTLIDAMASDDGFLRDEAALFFLKHEPGMAPRTIETLAEQIVDPLDGSDLLWGLIRKMREASPGSITPLVSALSRGSCGQKSRRAALMRSWR
jgi:hypothetical protein